MAGNQHLGFPVDLCPWCFKTLHFIHYSERCESVEHVPSHISCILREVTKICVWGKEGEKGTKGVFRDVITHTQVGPFVCVFWRWEV